MSPMARITKGQIAYAVTDVKAISRSLNVDAIANEERQERVQTGIDLQIGIAVDLSLSLTII